MSRDRNQGFEDHKFILGRIVDARQNSRVLRGYTAEAIAGGRMLDRTISDGSGRFLLEFDGRTTREMEFVDVCVLSSSGARIGAERVRTLELDSPKVLLFQAAQTMPAVVAVASADPNGPFVRFLANGEPSLLVESSCMDTTLEWAVVGTSESAELHLSLLADGRPIASELPPIGSHSVGGGGTAVYTLAVRTSSGSYSRRLIVKRFPTLSLCFDGTAVHRNGPISVGLMISCPAPREGLRVRLVSSDPKRVSGGDALIPAGDKWATVDLVAGDEAGDVDVTGIAMGYLRDAVRITIS